MLNRANRVRQIFCARDRNRKRAHSHRCAYTPTHKNAHIYTRIIDTCFNADIKNVSIVLGNKQELIKQFIPDKVNIIYQKKQLGTANAIKSASKYLENFNGKLLILYGDMPLIRKETILLRAAPPRSWGERTNEIHWNPSGAGAAGSAPVGSI